MWTFQIIEICHSKIGKNSAYVCVVFISKALFNRAQSSSAEYRLDNLFDGQQFRRKFVRFLCLPHQSLPFMTLFFWTWYPIVLVQYFIFVFYQQKNSQEKHIGIKCYCKWNTYMLECFSSFRGIHKTYIYLQIIC